MTEKYCYSIGEQGQESLGILENSFNEQTDSRISGALACMSNKQLEQILVDGKVMHTSVGGASLYIEVDNTSIFVKKVPFTDLELQPESSNINKLDKKVEF